MTWSTSFGIFERPVIEPAVATIGSRWKPLAIRLEDLRESIHSKSHRIESLSIPIRPTARSWSLHIAENLLSPPVVGLICQLDSESFLLLNNSSK